MKRFRHFFFPNFLPTLGYSSIQICYDGVVDEYSRPRSKYGVRRGIWDGFEDTKTERWGEGMGDGGFVQESGTVSDV